METSLANAGMPAELGTSVHMLEEKPHPNFNVVCAAQLKKKGAPLNNLLPKAESELNRPRMAYSRIYGITTAST